MIDKKPFRVTNEQAKKDSDCAFNCIDCSSDNPRSITIGCKKRVLRAYASDLLDSRELIDKQEAIIKEMREEISIVVSTASSETTKSELSYISNYTEMRDLLKKTKDYA